MQKSSYYRFKIQCVHACVANFKFTAEIFAQAIQLGVTLCVYKTVYMFHYKCVFHIFIHQCHFLIDSV